MQISNDEKIRLLRKLLDRSSSVLVEDSSDPSFKSWKNLVERTFIKIFGKESAEFGHFKELRFSYRALIHTISTNYTADHLRCFKQDFKILIDSINQYIEEIQEQTPVEEDISTTKSSTNLKKVFISHTSSDKQIVEEVIELLELVGLESNQIFCTSFEGYGIDLGEDFLMKIKEELSSDTLVLFILSKSFYESPVCLCEMGATWVLAKEHIPVLIPPLDYSDIKGVIPLTQGFKINETLKLNLFKDKIESLYQLDNHVSMSTWERKRDRIVTRIEKLLKNS